jgi:hypothetical protein
LTLAGDDEALLADGLAEIQDELAAAGLDTQIGGITAAVATSANGVLADEPDRRARHRVRGDWRRSSRVSDCRRRRASRRWRR